MPHPASAARSSHSPPERARHGTRIVRIADQNLPYGGLWTYELAPVDANSTSLKITENGFTNGWLFRFVGHYIFHEDTQIKQYEADLQKSIGK